MTTGMVDHITFRAALPEDDGFLCAVYASAREAELAMVPWNEAQREWFIRMQHTAQQQHYRQENPAAEQQLIFVGDEPAGRLYVDRRPHEIHILDLTLLPRFRNAGIGTGLIEALMAEAAESGRRVRIYVETFSRSRRLFERLGFVPVKDDGVNALFEWGS